MSGKWGTVSARRRVTESIRPGGASGARAPGHAAGRRCVDRLATYRPRLHRASTARHRWWAAEWTRFPHARTASAHDLLGPPCVRQSWKANGDVGDFEVVIVGVQVNALPVDI